MEILERNWFLIALILIGIFLALLIWTPWGNTGNKLEKFGEAADFQLTNTDNQAVTLESTKGKVRLMYFFFSYCPDVCLPTTAMLSKLQEELKSRNIFQTKTALISITFDPERDTIERLKEFSGNYDVDPAGWSFLRGDEVYTKDLALKYRLSIIKDKSGNFLHQNRFILIDSNGEIRQWYDPSDTELTIDQIANDMESLI